MSFRSFFFLDTPSTPAIPLLPSPVRPQLAVRGRVGVGWWGGEVLSRGGGGGGAGASLCDSLMRGKYL